MGSLSQTGYIILPVCFKCAPGLFPSGCWPYFSIQEAVYLLPELAAALFWAPSKYPQGRVCRSCFFHVQVISTKQPRSHIYSSPALSTRHDLLTQTCYHTEQWDGQCFHQDCHFLFLCVWGRLGVPHPLLVTSSVQVHQFMSFLCY